MTHYEIVEQAIRYLKENAKEQPDLEVIAAHVGLSPFHFQRVFQEWAGVTPKKFLQYLNLAEAKALLHNNRSTLETSLEVGLSGTSRLHDLFVTVEGMTPGEFKDGASRLLLNYSFANTRFGTVLIASTKKGICYLAFWPNKNEGLQDLQKTFSRAIFEESLDELQTQALKVLQSDKTNLSELKLHLKGTPFQLKVWEALLRLPVGSVCTYTDLAVAINAPTSARAVGNAVGSNLVAYLIPCHRVIRATGAIGDYRWGSPRKQAMLGWEAFH